MTGNRLTNLTQGMRYSVIPKIILLSTFGLTACGGFSSDEKAQSKNSISHASAQTLNGSNSAPQVPSPQMPLPTRSLTPSTVTPSVDSSSTSIKLAKSPLPPASATPPVNLPASTSPSVISASAGMLPAPPQPLTPQVIINNIYKVSLGRDADAAGLSYYVNQLSQGRAVSEIEFEIANSPEASIRQFYLGHLLREPDTAGMAYWLSAFKSGMSLSQIETHFKKANDCKKDCSLSFDAEKKVVTEYITGFYLSYLGHLPDAAGLQYFVDYILAGGSWEVAQNTIMNSPEAKIRQMYLTHLLREPDIAGMAYWLNQNSAGFELSQIKASIRNSEECKVDCL